MNVAIIGAAGSCGRQVAAQLLERNILPPSGRLQLVGHPGGRSADELWGLRADLEDAFVDNAPAIEVSLGPSAVDADVVAMLAGVTISTEPNASMDRAALGHTNHQIFVDYAAAHLHRTTNVGCDAIWAKVRKVNYTSALNRLALLGGATREEYPSRAQPILVAIATAS